MIKYIHKQLVLDCFPFVARKKGITDCVQNEAKALKQFLKNLQPSEEHKESHLLANIQNLSALSKVIEMEINETYEQIVKLKELAVELQAGDIKSYMPVVSDKRSEIVLEAVSSVEALRDTITLLETKFYAN
jgi:hypothetical protein